MSDGRWPGWVYETGDEPDVRFTFANERTFLAWIRTSLALVAAGVAVDVLDLDISDRSRQALAMLLVLLGLVGAPVAWVRWSHAERAIRRREPLPASRFTAVLAVGIIVAAVVVLMTL
jgi:putative membrane protein